MKPLSFLWGTALLAGMVIPGCGGAPDPPERVAAEMDEPGSSFRGVLLGDFDIRHARPLENQKIEIRFQLYASVSADKVQQLEKLAAARRHRLREQVITAVRSAETHEFDEPELLRIRRRIHRRLTKVVSEDLISDLYITELTCQID